MPKIALRERNINSSTLQLVKVRMRKHDSCYNCLKNCLTPRNEGINGFYEVKYFRKQDNGSLGYLYDLMFNINHCSFYDYCLATLQNDSVSKPGQFIVGLTHLRQSRQLNQCSESTAKDLQLQGVYKLP